MQSLYITVHHTSPGRPAEAFSLTSSEGRSSEAELVLVYWAILLVWFVVGSWKDSVILSMRIVLVVEMIVGDSKSIILPDHDGGLYTGVVDQRADEDVLVASRSVVWL
jgi:hypothetical protein